MLNTVESNILNYLVSIGKVEPKQIIIRSFEWLISNIEKMVVKLSEMTIISTFKRYLSLLSTVSADLI